MNEVLLATLAIWNVLLTWTIIRNNKKFKQSVKDTIKALEGLTQIAENQVNTLGEHQKLHKSQDGLNSVLIQYLEFLAVHAKLIKPSVAFEAEQFLMRFNKKKEEENGDV
jgi:hypothetical protein